MLDQIIEKAKSEHPILILDQADINKLGNYILRHVLCWYCAHHKDDFLTFSSHLIA